MRFARNVKIIIFYEETDISECIQNSISALNYTDNSKDAIDDLEINLENLDHRWLHEWFPDENARLIVGIIETSSGTPKFLNLGVFYVDEPTFDDDTLALKCLALTLDQSLREQENSNSWEKVKLSELGNQLANKHQMMFELHAEDEYFERLDQDKETDLGFLKRILSETDLSLKISEDKIIIFSEEFLQKQEPITTFSITDNRIRHRILKKKNQGVYDEVEVNYYDADKKRHVIAVAKKENCGDVS